MERESRESWEQRVRDRYPHAQIQEGDGGIQAVTPSGHVVGYYDRHTNSFVLYDNRT